MFGFNKILIKTLKNTINELEKDLENQKYINKIHEHNEVILLDNLTEAREKIQNLENNLEFVTNNLSAQNKQKIGL